MLDFLKRYSQDAQELSTQEILFNYDQFHFDHSYNPHFDLNQALLPHTHDYYLPFSPHFLFNLSSYELIQKLPVIWVRDGKRPLQDFFQACPHPSAQSARLLIHHELRSLVPTSWQERCAFYAWSYAPALICPPQMAPDFLLMSGPLFASYSSLEHLRSRLESVAEFLGPRALKSCPHYWIVNTAPDPKVAASEQDVGSYLKLMEDFSGNHLQKISWQEWTELGPKKNGLWVDFQEKLNLVADSFVHHASCSQGLTLFHQHSSSSLEKSGAQTLHFPLSPYHSAVVYT